jgi:hypothetical protein
VNVKIHAYRDRLLSGPSRWVVEPSHLRNCSSSNGAIGQSLLNSEAAALEPSKVSQAGVTAISLSLHRWQTRSQVGGGIPLRALRSLASLAPTYPFFKQQFL